MGVERAVQSLTYLDTHVVCWLFEADFDKFSKTALSEIEKGELIISPIVDLELQYLFEIKRITDTPDTIISYLQEKIELQVSAVPFHQVIRMAKSVNWTRDPFDRIISAEVLCIDNAVLVTKDSTIRQHLESAVW